MTNREKYKEEILDIACRGHRIAIRECDRKLVECDTLCCEECVFGFNGESGCMSNRKAWCNSEYEEPKVDWSKVEVDTPILVRQLECDEWSRRYFAKYERGTLYAWGYGCTSWSQTGITNWKYAKLAESEE